MSGSGLFVADETRFDTSELRSILLSKSEPKCHNMEACNKQLENNLEVLAKRLPVDDIDTLVSSANNYSADCTHHVPYFADISTNFTRAINLKPSLLNDSNTDFDKCETSNIFDNLPTELHYKVLSYLTPEELCCSVAPVCKRWHRLAYEPILWQRLQFDNDVPLAVVNQILKRSTLVRWLRLYSFPEIWYLVPPLINCRLLKSLDLKLCGGLNAHNLSLLVKHCPFVEELNVEGCRSIECASVAEIVGWSRLKRLNLSHCTLLNNESVVLIARKLENLEELNIDGIASITDPAACVVTTQRKKSIRKLFLDGDELTDATYCSLVNCFRLVELSVSFAELMSDQGLFAIKELTLLRHLRVKRGSELSETGLKELFESNNMSKLTLLDLTGCSHLDDVGIDAMTKCCSNLKYLSLGWCWDISDKGLEAIVNRCRCMETMDLVGLVKITGACLVKLPENLPYLTYLDLQQCSRIIDDVVKDVVRRKPDLKVLNYYGEQFVLEDDDPLPTKIVVSVPYEN